ncbi:MAG: hypothetical protein COT26_00790 [Candidatus Kerfeldbacteria bacterium CG08_land_8_20_14_0_20_43_14]|uniref:Uncharacterized protein n=1 Tax=Candidatus Kerfeldbacteria bacterium CG08_land_8_20_14_0_20_43_14 TaxID=2014246 RepID=A0A2H0YR12_9BACT|nr:MAG: hypothetical protein COT26_00790 [Candidatus Kerfeldbacteria bacterium CG08_land_8_20_14_0_20_43_14]
MLVFHEQPHEKVRVFVDFSPGQNNFKRVIPRAFFWAGKRYDIQSVNLVYQRRRGNKQDWCFAVSDQANAFVLLFNPENLEWILEEVQGQ